MWEFLGDSLGAVLGGALVLVGRELLARWTGVGKQTIIPRVRQYLDRTPGDNATIWTSVLGSAKPVKCDWCLLQTHSFNKMTDGTNRCLRC